MVASIASALDPAIRTEAALRWQAAGIGASLSGLAAGILHFAYPDGTWVAVIGVPVGAIVGFLSAPRVISTTSPKVLAIVLAVIAPVIGVGLVVAVVVLVPSLMIGLPLTIPVSFAAVGLLRWIRRLRADRQAVAVVVLLAAAVGVGVLAVADTGMREAREAARVGSYDEEPWLQRALAPVRLDWVVINRSSQYLTMFLEEPSDGGWSGSELSVMACATSARRIGIGHGWRIGPPVVDPWMDPDMSPFDIPPLVAEEDPPARDVTITIDIAPDGIVSVTRGGVLPTEGQLDQPLCQVDPMSRGSLSAARGGVA
jgi:hypothetical protein